MRISDWSSDVCSSDLSDNGDPIVKLPAGITVISGQPGQSRNLVPGGGEASSTPSDANCSSAVARGVSEIERVDDRGSAQADVPSTRNARTPIHCRSEEHTSELQSLMRISYAVFCLKKK